MTIQWRTQNFSMRGSVTPHRNDVEILQLQLFQRYQSAPDINVSSPNFIAQLQFCNAAIMLQVRKKQDISFTFLLDFLRFI